MQLKFYLSIFTFSFCSLESSKVYFYDGMYEYMANDIAESALKALLHGSSSINSAFTDKIDRVLRKIGLPPHPELDTERKGMENLNQ